MSGATVAITGVNGFVGHHVARELVRSGYNVVGIGRDSDPSSDLAGILGEYVSADLTTGWPALPKITAVIHLAGLASVGDSFAMPQEYIATNSAMVTAMCESLLAGGDRVRVVGVSSGAVYASGSGAALDEESPIFSSSPYVVSKLLLENQLSYYVNRGLDCVTVRPFNHSGPGQGSGYLIPDLVERARAAARSGSTMTVGNLDTARDYTDVRDVAIAYRLLATTPTLAHRLYNLSTGVAVAGTEILAMTLEALSAEDVPVERVPSLMRPTDAPLIAGDSTRLRHDVGWAPGISLRQTIHDVVAATA